MQLMKAFAQQQVVGKGQRCVKTKKKGYSFMALFLYCRPPFTTLRLLVDDERNDFPLRLIDDGFKSI